MGYLTQAAVMNTELVYWNGRQAVCWCPSYDFPHRLGGGSCTGYHMAKDCFDNCKACIGCELIGSYGCEVIAEISEPRHCPYVQNFIAEYQIRL